MDSEGIFCENELNFCEANTITVNCQLSTVNFKNFRYFEMRYLLWKT